MKNRSEKVLYIPEYCVTYEMKYGRKNHWILMEFPHVISSTEKCNACSRERYPSEDLRGAAHRQLLGFHGGMGKGADTTVADSGG